MMRKGFQNHWVMNDVFALSGTIVSKKRLLRCFVALFLVMLSTMTGVSLADENTDRRVDISLSIFPRIVAVDNHFRDKLNADKKAHSIKGGALKTNILQTAFPTND